MKINWTFIKFTLLVGLIVFLFSFTHKRNNARMLKKPKIEFLDDNNPFITLATVNKLLIQNNDSVMSVSKEALVLKQMESRLLQNDMIRDAEVFVTVDGVLGAKIEQRNPIARVTSGLQYYIDEDGKKMPLSSVYSARVPIVTGISKIDLEAIKPLLLTIYKDEFLRKSVVGITISENGNSTLQFRKHNFKVQFGKPNNIDRKFQNFKAFYQKTIKDKTLNNYRIIDLQFGNQVVATKKE